MVLMIPAVTTTGAANQRLPGLSGSLVEIYRKNYGCQINIQLPSRKSDLSYVEADFSIDPAGLSRLTVTGDVRAGQLEGPATRPQILGRRNRNPRVYPSSRFSMSFDLPYPAEPVSFHIANSGMAEVYIRKI